MIFNIDELEQAKYDNFERNEQGLVLSCTLTDSQNNTVYVKNIEWSDEEPKSFFIQDKAELPTEMFLLKKIKDSYMIVEEITNLSYGNNGLAKSFVKTLFNKEQFFIYDIEYNENKKIIYCKQRQENGTEREFFDFVFDENGKFQSCTQKILGAAEEDLFTKNILNKVNIKSSLNEITQKIYKNDLSNLDESQKENFLKKLTAMLQILAGIRSSQVSNALDNNELNAKDVISRTRYKLDTPLLQVFSSINNTQSDINGEKTLIKILEIVENRFTGKLISSDNPIFEKVVNNLSNLILEKVFSGNYALTEFGYDLVNLGFKLKAQSEVEAISFAIKHLYYNVNNLLEEKEIATYHYKKLDNFILIKL